MTAEQLIQGRRITVLGMARSGVAAAKLALAKGATVFVSDSAPREKLAEPLAELSRFGIPHECGGHTDRVLNADYIIISPGVPLKAPIVKTALERGLPVFSELEFASWVCPGRIVAITGANGKTTTTTLVGEILTSAGLDTHVCGNIGLPFADLVVRMTEQSVAVVEVSSFQLETIADFHPHVSAILNLTPDHIDRHGSFEAYKQAKYRITENQTGDDVFVLNREDAESVKDDPSSRARKAWFTTENDPAAAVWVADGKLKMFLSGGAVDIIKTDRIAIKGPHNLQNAAAAAAMCLQLGVDAETMARVLESFPGVEHRLEDAGTVAGIKFINDSKATNVDSVRYALRSVATPLYLIAGGRDKDSDFRPLLEAGKGRIKGVIVIGEAAQKIYDTLGQTYPTEFCAGLNEAVERAFEKAIPGETVLLSPGCASFDQFDNYEHRGRVFKEAVRGLKNGKNSDETVTR